MKKETRKSSCRNSSELSISVRLFWIWKLEYYFLSFNVPELYPKGRKHLGGGWFWRKEHEISLGEKH